MLLQVTAKELLQAIQEINAFAKVSSHAQTVQSLLLVMFLFFFQNNIRHLSPNAKNSILWKGVGPGALGMN